MNIQIRILTEDDAREYRELRLKSYQEAPLAFSESYEDEKERSLADFKREIITRGDPPEWFVLGAFSRFGKLVGFVRFRRDLRSKARHKSMIHAMYSDQQYRNQVIGKKLVEDLLLRVKRIAGLEQIHLWVLHSTNSASEFYKKCGFESQGPVIKKDLKVGNVYVDAEYMVMHLSKDNL